MQYYSVGEYIVNEFKNEGGPIMSEKNEVKAVSEEELSSVAGGATRNYLAAVDVMNGKYGNGEERKARLQAAGYDYWAVQHLVNGLAKGYDQVARDVIAGKYGDNQYRIAALNAKGYDAALVQDIVNGMLLN
ncbi:MAG: hypothetical protein K6C12_05895 [Oscillospiraceae bacterium]|nr:hypothetical protein [Oscillospiraceae bacterium]